MMNSAPSVHRAPASEAVVCRIANCEGVDPTDLRPLYDAVDPEALDALLDGREDRSEIQIEFSYHGYRVTVTGEGVVHLDEAEASPRATA